MSPTDPIPALPVPASHLIDLAVEVSGWSPCRSKRGVVIFSEGNVISHGHNYKPGGFECDGSDTCKATCRSEAVHAEQQALMSAVNRAHASEMLHVKTVDGKLVPSGGPSCVECSKLALAAGIAWFWLYHDTGWRRYAMAEFHALSLNRLRALVPLPATPTEELFPIQRQPGAKAHRLRIPWSVAEKAYSVYSAKFGTSQSLERMAERGGFCPDEMDDFHPAWREESDELFALKAELVALRNSVAFLPVQDSSQSHTPTEGPCPDCLWQLSVPCEKHAGALPVVQDEAPKADDHDRFMVSTVTWLRGMGYTDAANAITELHVEDRALRGLPGLVFCESEPLGASRPSPADRKICECGMAPLTMCENCTIAEYQRLECEGGITDIEKELNGWRELGEEIGRVISLMPAETFADWFPDWFGPRLFDLQVAGPSPADRQEEKS